MENKHIKYVKIKALGHKENLHIFSNPDDAIVLEEKVDGANFQFTIKDGKIILGSLTRTLDDDMQEGKFWKRCCDYIKATVKPLKKYEGYIFYGECCRKHTIAYDFENMPPFLGFDIYDTAFGIFTDYLSASAMFKSMGLQFVPIMCVAKASQIPKITDTFIPKSQYYDGQCEGIVFKNYNTQVFAKYVREKFKEDNNTAFGGTPKYEENDSGKLMARYCTNARIKKMIYKLRNDGENIQMEMMKLLPKLVYADIVNEEWSTILFSNYKIDCHTMRKIVSKRCAAVLKQMMVNEVI